jgi:hypothetical protein
MGKAKLIAASDSGDAFTEFTGVTRMRMGVTPSGVLIERPPADDGPGGPLQRSVTTSALSSGPRKNLFSRYLLLLFLTRFFLSPSLFLYAPSTVIRYRKTRAIPPTRKDNIDSPVRCSRENQRQCFRSTSGSFNDTQQYHGQPSAASRSWRYAQRTWHDAWLERAQTSSGQWTCTTRSCSWWWSTRATGTFASC